MLYLLIPTFNEEQNVNKLSLLIKQLVQKIDYRILIVDDCSSDKTVDLLRGELVGFDIEILTKTENKGPGDSFKIGFLRILENSKNDHDQVLTFEADNTISVADLTRLIYIAGAGFDLVLASPYAQGEVFKKLVF